MTTPPQDETPDIAGRIAAAVVGIAVLLFLLGRGCTALARELEESMDPYADVEEVTGAGSSAFDPAQAGETVRWEDGLEVTVDRLRRVPAAGACFAWTVTLDNGSDEAVDIAAGYSLAEELTVPPGEEEWDVDGAAFPGRLAPGERARLSREGCVPAGSAVIGYRISTADIRDDAHWALPLG
ncbi:hypothetical protein RM780_08235 [Streptomyces sp. DSM 44917]|uniref:DUF4352 domain-containing protein n=1 Tax=Streptomyces boetiae TaxID=3075541 RepID=A0ABU2L5V7_9ACTN|nr:hypothetical protein [Streptomyces sp. DSM 44917]MDT0306951.1 hypothetical protein [Streptomyces sp. DSM 44917]